MKTRFSLFTRIFLWFLISFTLVGGLAALFFVYQFRLASDSMLESGSMQRIRAAVRLIREEITSAPREQWDAILARWSAAYEVNFLLYTMRGEKIAGEGEVPASVIEKFERRGRFMARTNNPLRFYFGMPMPLEGLRPFGPRRAILVVQTDAKGWSNLFSDPVPWMILIPLALGLSILLWIPLVRNLTRPIKEMTRAAEEISRGRFEVRVDDSRTDEIGRLGRAINDMAARISGLLGAQKRLLADVSHEVRSPLARIQVILELLEPQASEKEKGYIKDGLEEIGQASEMIGELLAVARAENDPRRIKLETVALAPLVQKLIDREKNRGSATIAASIEDGLCVSADARLLSRAIGNLLRNSAQYAGDAGPIRLTARRVSSAVEIEVADEGPGVPEGALPRLFDPFFRPDADRNRDAGGAGLGLAIAKTCVDACQGKITAQNLAPRGFTVKITLQAH